MSADFLPGNHVELLENGAQYFPALLAAIDNAACEVRLETYIFAYDATGLAVVAALTAAARRGVAVSLLVDGFGARDFADGLGKLLVAAGATVEVYRPEAVRFKMRRHRLRRLHRKLAVIDGRIAFVGGINIIDDFDIGDTTSLEPRLDYAVRITGPLVARIHASMQHLWRLIGWAKLQHRQPSIPFAPCGNTAPPGNIAAAFVIRDNLGHRRDIEEAYLTAITSAHTEILLASAYFLPGHSFRRALRDATARGVAVTILLQGQVEYALLHYATQALYRELLADGAHIFEYAAGFLHAKVAVVDGSWATVGSSNIDPFSLLLAREANVLVQDAGFAAQLRASLHHAIASAHEVTHAGLIQGSQVTCWLRRLAYGLVRLLLGITRYGSGDYQE